MEEERKKERLVLPLMLSFLLRIVSTSTPETATTKKLTVAVLRYRSRRQVIVRPRVYLLLKRNDIASSFKRHVAFGASGLSGVPSFS